MSLKAEIGKIFEANSKYSNPGQAVNQASSLNALSSDLYTDSRRFIYELLQNADDSAPENHCIKVWIKLIDNYLIVAHSGSVFNPRDLQGICNINNGTKRTDSSKTGYKGIGFKSVFGQSQNVIIYTNNEYFRFDSSYDFGWNWDETKEKWEQLNEREFQFPWQIIPIYTESKEIPDSINHYIQGINTNVATIIKLNNVKETSEAIQILSKNLNMFLFLKNITNIQFDITDSSVLAIDRSHKDRINLIKNGESEANWLINNIKLEVPNELKVLLENERNIPEKLLITDYIELSFAAKIDKEGISKLNPQERLLYAYLPTDETRYSFPVLVNTSFLTTANREALHGDSNWNKWLFKNIAVEIFKWISKLVKSEFEYQVYRLIPNKTISDELGNEFNKGIDEALTNVPFIPTEDGDLIKVKDTIVDFTFLSEKAFVGKDSIKKFIDTEKVISSKKFAVNTGFGNDFKRLGATSFEWNHLSSFIKSKSFIDAYSIKHNIELARYLKHLCDEEKTKEISIEKLRSLPFIWDHKNNLKCPAQICFPASGDNNWNNPESDLSFLHLELQNWLVNEPEIRYWLEDLGMSEKTDISYITQTIIPHVENYVTDQNAIQIIQDLFVLYKKGELKEELIKQLSPLKLLTQKKKLLPANHCYLSNFYKPRLEIEGILEMDFYVHELYCTNNTDKDEWKRFFKMMGVKEGIEPLYYPEKVNKQKLLDLGYRDNYFEDDDKKFKPLQTTFISESYAGFLALSHIQYIENRPKFAFEFWTDVIKNHPSETILVNPVAYWGYHGRHGQINGDKVGNYLSWFVNNVKCIPTVSGECQVASSVILNKEEIIIISGDYLPVFSGPILTSDWKSFFGFRTNLELLDYLEILRRISIDTDDSNCIRKGNEKRVQSIYSVLLDQCANWSSEDISKVKSWTENNSLLNTKNQFTNCTNLKYFLDGSDSIFQEQFDFLYLNSENKMHASIEEFLDCINVTILKQSDFELEHIQKERCLDLMDKLRAITPYFKIWIEDEVVNDETIDSIKNLQNRIEALNIYQTHELKIKYTDINFSKNVNVHFNNGDLLVTHPWGSNSVLLKLPEVLCRYLSLVGHSKKLDFLLRANLNEIQSYLAQEGIAIPNEISQSQIYNSLINFDNIVDEGSVPLEGFFHTSVSDYKKFVHAKKIIVRSVFNVLNHLKKIPEYDCTHAYKLAESIIGGITKNGNDISVVARPSDGGEVLPYYESEFDVLEYVDAEFWCEDGIHTPKQITLGQLLKKTGINRIPISTIQISGTDFEAFINKKKSETFDFNAVPFAPEKVARIISSFANTEGGTLIFGLKEINPNLNEIVGLSSDFRVEEIVKKAVSLLSIIPQIKHDWVRQGDYSIYFIQIEKAEQPILLENQKFIRVESKSISEKKAGQESTLNAASYVKTVAIIIAIENYAPRAAHKISNVKYAKADALKFKKVLINHLNVDESDIYIYLDDQALKSTLEYDLKGLLYTLTKDDRLIFYYVGHGFHNGLTNYLSTYDMHKFNISGTAVSLRKILLDPLQKSNCKNALIFIDACAQSFQDENERNEITDINDEEFLLLTNEFPYYATFLSCLPGQSSYSSDILNNGIWTYHLVKALSGEVTEVIYKNKYITDTLLKDYLSRSVPIYTNKELGYNQNPKAILDSSCQNVILELKNT